MDQSVDKVVIVDLQTQRIALETSRYRITGTVSLPRDGYRSRLTDYLNAAERSFVALTDVDLEPLDSDRDNEQHPFLAVAISQIVFARPLETDVSEPAADETGAASRVSSLW